MIRRLITLALTGLLAVPALADYEPGQGSFAFNQALYYHYSQDHLSAAILALELDRREQSDNPARQRFIADNLLSYGLHREALSRFRLLVREGELSTKDRADMWLRLARYEYERGYFDAALATLTEMRVDVGARRNRTERAQLLAQIQLRRGEPEAAIETLNEGRVYTKDDFARYNLGMAYIANEEVRRGRRELDILGRQLVSDPTEHALRDKANLALAYNYLAEAKGGSARPVLQRIRLHGPYADEALLGLGWAEISADKADEIRLTEEDNADTISGVLGTILRPGKVDEDLRQRLGLLRSGKEPETAQDRFKQALIPWLELDGRDPKKPAVLEVQLAIPYALTELGEEEQARRFYERAVQRLETGRVGLAKAIDGIRSGRMLETMIRRDPEREAGWNWRLRDLPDAPETYYLGEILAQHNFQEALKNYRDLRQLQRKLAFDRERLNNEQLSRVQASVNPTRLLAERLKDQPPLWGEQPMTLKLETRLGRFPRNETLEGLLAWTYRYARGLTLTLDPNRPRVGVQSLPPEMAEIAQRIDSTLDQITPLLREQRALLERIAVGELERQKTLLTRYLIDARFALARLYDEAQADIEDDAQ